MLDEKASPLASDATCAQEVLVDHDELLAGILFVACVLPAIAFSSVALVILASGLPIWLQWGRAYLHLYPPFLALAGFGFAAVNATPPALAGLRRLRYDVLPH